VFVYEVGGVGGAFVSVGVWNECVCVCVYVGESACG